MGRVFALLGVLVIVLLAAAQAPPRAASNQGAKAGTSDDAAKEIQRLLGQLASPRFIDRDAAAKRLAAIGEPALDPLRKAVETAKDVEVQRRCQILIDRIEGAVLSQLLADGIREHKNKNFKKALALFEEALQKGFARWPRKPPNEEIPYVVEVSLHAARVLQDLKDYEKSARMYATASYYASGERRREVMKEWSAVAEQLLAQWTELVKAKVAAEPVAKALSEKHSLVVLHSRRYAGGGYFRSAFSFLYETSDPDKHYNDVQLLFDNGGVPKRFTLNMVGNQENRAADLGKVDFDKDPDPRDKQLRWSNEEVEAKERHVYLYHAKDEHGNDFFVLFQVVAVDGDSRFTAFVWRRLPGGKVVKR